MQQMRGTAQPGPALPGSALLLARCQQAQGQGAPCQADAMLWAEIQLELGT